MNDFDERLIQLVEKRALLYDKSHRDFKNDKMKGNAWESIASVLHSNGEDVQKRWNSLRDRFVRAHRNVSKTPGSGTGVADVPKVSFPFYENMLWLVPHVRKRKLAININAIQLNEGTQLTEETEFINVDSQISVKIESDQHSIVSSPLYVPWSEGTTSRPGPSSREESSSGSESVTMASLPAQRMGKKRHIQENINDSLSDFINTKAAKHDKQNDDADIMFMKSVANDMQYILNPAKKIKFKREVLELLEKYVNNE